MPIADLWRIAQTKEAIQKLTDLQLADLWDEAHAAAAEGAPDVDRDLLGEICEELFMRGYEVLWDTGEWITQRPEEVK